MSIIVVPVVNVEGVLGKLDKVRTFPDKDLEKVTKFEDVIIAFENWEGTVN